VSVITDIEVRPPLKARGTNDLASGTFPHAKCYRAYQKKPDGTSTKTVPLPHYPFSAIVLLSKAMDDDNKCRLENLARRWLELAEQEERGDEGYLEAAE
jgi:hypothetical protein